MFKKMKEKKMRKINGGYKWDDKLDDTGISGGSGPRGINRDLNYSAAHYVKDFINQR